MWKKHLGLTSLLAGVITFAMSIQGWAQTCPTDATDTAVAVALSALRINPDGSTGAPVGPNPIGICERIRLRMSIGYVPIGPSGGVTAFFEGGSMTIRNQSGSFSDNVTPAGGVPLIGEPSDPEGQACGAGAVNSFLSDFSIDYVVNPADIDGAGNITFLANFVGGNLRFGAGIAGQPTGTTAIQVHVDLGPSCSILPASQTVCAGASATFTATGTGQAPPFTFTWTGPGGFTATGATITINNAQAANAGTYTATVTDAHGCTSTCTATLAVTPNPTCSITGDSPVCPGTTHTYTSTVAPAGGSVTHNWTISGNGTINGAANGATVSVTAGASGSFTLTDNVTRDGCPGVCTLTVPITPPPTCTITGDNPVCPGSTHTYSSAVQPAGGTVTHSWSISGNGTINGSSTGPSVSVTAGPFAGGTSFTLTDNITRDGCPGQCTLVVTIQPCNPEITVDKTVACVPPSGTCDGSLTYANSATGVQGAAFCYRITVCNPPNAQEPLNNVVVNDPDLGGNLPGFPPTLAVGQCETRYFEKTWPVTGNTDTHVNTVRASGVGGISGISTNDVDDATVELLPIGVECDVTLSSSFDMDGRCDVTLPEGSVDTPVQFTLTLRNTGALPINVTSLPGLPSLVDCDTGAPVVPIFPIALGVGQTVTLVGCVSVSCPEGATYSLSAHAEVDAQGGAICIYDSNGNIISTDSAACNACVDCAQPVTCRVTGGGQLIPGFVDQSCIEVNTTIFPFTSPNGLTIKKITHGGQLGAPFSHMDCGAILGNPCIRGQWQHTRHYEGKANPRDVFDMNFHSQTPKGQYDSLSCACLGCCDPVTGAFIPPTQGPLIHKFQLCNPDDHKVCGPMPRPSPANAIIWSGIGKVTPVDDVRGSRAAQAEWVIFRVYIEDRSEPGGGHPGGAVEPADIYCFQAWKTGIKVSKKPDFSTVAAAFRTALGAANCEFLDSLSAGTLPIGTLPSPTVDGVTADIQDCGPMHDGNHQIHPSTGATCTQ